MIALRSRFWVLGLILSLASPAAAQNYGNQTFTRTNPKFLEIFRDVISTASQSTVRVQCDEKDVSLGVVVDADGLILTKAHDLHGKITVRLRDSGDHEAKIIGIHKDHDLALLKIDASELTPVEFKDSKSVAVGDWVASVGAGQDPIAVGVVSVATRQVANKGPTFTVDQSKAGYLGISLEQLEAGVKINQVMPNTAAAKAGLKVEDVILALSGKKIREVEGFIQTIAKKKPGEVVKLKVRRGEETLDVEATLGKRPANMARSDIQNRMGSELSNRRSGYPTILQHDSVVKPADCGGPIVDLHGRVLGINICRAARTESWTVPAEVILKVLPDLKSGKLAPPETKEEEPEEQLSRELRSPSENVSRTARSESPPNEQVLADNLLSLMRQRLEIMERVAIYKWSHKQPVHDPDRERQLLDSLVKRGAEKALTPDLVRAFFVAQFAAARLYQENCMRPWNDAGRGANFANVPDLQKELRPRIDKVSDDLLVALANIQPHLKNDAFRGTIRARAAVSLQGQGISAAIREAALAGWLSETR